jgi:hypothetical protein
MQKLAVVLQEGADTMAGTTIQTTSPVSAAELLEQGFSPLEIRKLSELRETWNPAAEQVDSLLEWRRIQFVKWLYEHGHYAGD